MKRILLFVVLLFTFSGSGIVAHLYNRDDCFSLRYVLWKNGFHPYPSDIIWNAGGSDQHRNDLIRGKTKAEIKQIFSNVHQEPVNEYQKRYEKELQGQEYLWLGGTNRIIFLKDGTGHYISIMKG